LAYINPHEAMQESDENKAARMQVLDNSGMRNLLDTVYECIKDKPIGSTQFKRWVCHFKGNMIGHLGFVILEEQNTVELYRVWDNKVIARICYKDSLESSSPSTRMIGKGKSKSAQTQWLGKGYNNRVNFLNRQHHLEQKWHHN